MTDTADKTNNVVQLAQRRIAASTVPDGPIVFDDMQHYATLMMETIKEAIAPLVQEIGTLERALAQAQRALDAANVKLAKMEAL